jgi:hypothetical protein
MRLKCAALSGAAATPKEMRVRGGEMVEEVLSPGQQIVADRIDHRRFSL